LIHKKYNQKLSFYIHLIKSMSSVIYPISKVSVYIGEKVWDIRSLTKAQLVKLRQILLDVNYADVNEDVAFAIQRYYNVLQSLSTNDSPTTYLRIENAILNFVGQWYMNTQPRGSMPTENRTTRNKQKLTTATFNVGQLPIRTQMDDSNTLQILAQMEQLQNDLKKCQERV
jgi:hypothetical protein